MRAVTREEFKLWRAIHGYKPRVWTQHATFVTPLKRLPWLVGEILEAAGPLQEAGVSVKLILPATRTLQLRAPQKCSSIARKVRTLNDIRAMPKTIDKERPQAIVTWTGPFTYQHRHSLIPAVAQRLAVIGDGRELADLGAVLTYGVDWLDMFRRSATYVDKILKGAKPGELPIEQPTKFNLVVNLKAAKLLGIKIPETMLVRADEITR